MLNNCDIRNIISRYQWFYRKVNVQSHHQQASDKGYEQTMESDVDVSVYSKNSSGWSGLQISLHGSKQVTKYGSYLK